LIQESSLSPIISNIKVNIKQNNVKLSKVLTRPENQAVLRNLESFAGVSM
jgi:hypothetical protein